MENRLTWREALAKGITWVISFEVLALIARAYVLPQLQEQSVQMVLALGFALVISTLWAIYRNWNRCRNGWSSRWSGRWTEWRTTWTSLRCGDGDEDDSGVQTTDDEVLLRW
jgi:hypothetical protein